MFFVTKWMNFYNFIYRLKFNLILLIKIFFNRKMNFYKNASILFYLPKIIYYLILYIYKRFIKKKLPLFDLRKSFSILVGLKKKDLWFYKKRFLPYYFF